MLYRPSHREANNIPVIAVSSTGRKFSNYARSLDSTNVAYTVAELHGNDTETPYPSAQINSPPGGAINYSVSPAVGANYENYFIGVQSVVIDPLDRLWVLDTGRAAMSNGTNVPASLGGPKLVGIDLTTNQVIKTIVFPLDVAYQDSYINDVRFDLRSSLPGTSGQGVAYITDASQEGRNGIILVDLGSGESWRHLDGIQQVRPESDFAAFIWGEAVYSLPRGSGGPIARSSLGSDGIALSADGSTLYFSVVAGRNLYSVPTARLLDRSQASELLATQSVVSHGQKGVSDGLETDSNGLVYVGSFENNAINIFFPNNGTVSVFVRDPRIGWADSLAVGADGYLYFSVNQLWRSPMFYPGTDRRVKPYPLFRVPCPDGGKKVILK